MTIQAKFSQALAFLFLVAFAVFVGVPQSAMAVAITNASFEDDPVGPGNFAFGNNGWTAVGSFGRFEGSGDFGENAAPTDGDQMAFFAAGAGSSARQTLGDNFAALTDYQLLVDISARAPYGTEAVLRLVLYRNNNLASVVKSIDLDGTMVPNDDFNTFSFTATAAEVFAAGAIGQSIGIAFVGVGDNLDFDLDNVRLNAIPVPEPSTCALLLLSSASMLMFRRRQR